MGLSFREKVFIKTGANKAMNGHFPECYRCNKKYISRCIHYKKFQFFKYIFIISNNMINVLKLNLHDGEMTFTDFTECIKVVQYVIENTYNEVDFLSLNNINTFDRACSAVISKVDEFERNNYISDMSFITDNYDKILIEEDFRDKVCSSFERCEKCNLPDIYKEKCISRIRLMSLSLIKKELLE